MNLWESCQVLEHELVLGIGDDSGYIMTLHIQ